MPGLWTVRGYPVEEFKPLEEPVVKEAKPPPGKRALREARGKLPEGMKRCACCKKVKRHADFGRDYCYVCHRLKRRKSWQKQNPIPAVELYAQQGKAAPGRRRLPA
jgi:hypothetical protein